MNIGDKVTLIKDPCECILAGPVKTCELYQTLTITGKNGQIDGTQFCVHESWVQPCLYVYRDAKHLPDNRLWIEVCLGDPVHALDMPDRIRYLFSSSVCPATMSDIAIRIVQRLVRHGELHPVTLIVVDENGIETEAREPNDWYLHLAPIMGAAYEETFR